MVDRRAWVHLILRIFLDSWPFWVSMVALESWEVWLSNGVTDGTRNGRNKEQAGQELSGSAVPGTWIACCDNTRYYNFVVPWMAHETALILERPIPMQKKPSPN